MYVACEDMHVYAFDLAQGRRVWQSSKLPGVSFRGYHPVVAPDGSICFMEEFGNLVSLDADGHERWSYPSGWVQTGSPVICQDGKVLFLSTSGLTALSADGELLWQNNFQSPAFGPVVLDGKRKRVRLPAQRHGLAV